MSRRAVLSGATGGAAAIALGVVGGSATAPRPAAAATLRPIGMAMHIHATFSEGRGSFDAHLDQAHRNGVDVIWWTDHDFRVAAHDHRRAVHFDAATEPEGGLPWTWAKKTEGTLATAALEFVDTSHSPDDPSRALRLSATGGSPGGGTLWYAGTAWNYTYSTCIADTTLQLDVRPEKSGPAATFTLRIELSHHPARGGRPAGVYVLNYRVGATYLVRHRASGLTGTVDLPLAPGPWTRLTIDPVDDVRRLWPDLVAVDNSLRNLRVGVTAGASADVSFVVDRLIFNRSRRGGQDAEDLRAEVLANYRDEYSDVTHYRAYEVSLVRHLNWFGGDQTLPSFPSPPYRDNDPTLAASMVDFLHGHGGIVCWNHPLDVETRDSLALLMIERNKLGVDLVEIGRSPQTDLLWVYDVAARNALFFTAVGASDDHDGTDWLTEPERMITYVWAESTRKDDLVAALRRGRAWFADLARYRGSVDIRSGGATVMGGVAITGASTVPLELVATGLPKGSTLEVVTGVADLAGAGKLAPSTTVQKVAATAVTNGRYTFNAKPGNGSYVRTMVRLSDKTLAAVSNPVWLLRKAPPRGIPADRKLPLA
jgi:hypothetical protein